MDMEDSDAKPLFGRRETDPYLVMREDELLEEINVLIGEERVRDIARIILKLEDDKAIAENALYFARNVDALTSAVSKTKFQEALESSVALFENRKIPFSVVNIDLSKFKTEINDVLGHKKGDEALIETVRIIRNSVRPTDLVIRRNDENDPELPRAEEENFDYNWEVARMGGDEFLIILEGADGEEAKLVMERILEKLAKAKEESSAENIIQKINMNYGILEWQDGMTVEGFMEEADKRMYEQKRGSADNPKLDTTGV